MGFPISDRGSLGVGIVGLSASGGWAANAHVPALSRLPGYELRGLASSSAATAKAAGDKFGVALAFDDVQRLAECEEIDLIVVTVKVPEHRDLVMTALGAGKAVLCEWPLGNGLGETEQLADAARSRGLPGFVGLQARSAPTIRYMRDLVADGFVGEVLSTSVIGSGGSWGASIDARNAYTLDRDNGATMLTIPFGHTVDALTMVLGEFADLSVTTAIRRQQVTNGDSGTTLPMTAEDQIAVTGALDSGAVASMHFRGGMSAGTNLLWEINGTAGDLVLTGNSGHLQLADVELRGARSGDALAAMTPPRRYELAPSDQFGDAPRAYNIANAYAQIRDDLLTGTAVAPTFEHAVRRHRLLDRIQGKTLGADSVGER
ncbi:Gfo/Idh/MocA family oxidoreductase [Rhodococcus pseudokoreensis]|uniref:Gfo/Idh/MocA family oxidoreductase n=1 Tax=Rhodococcus pseudokoreensis TaxID=2811421 RepID=A0A974W6M9_9NOCA|nr:Gfo/Idh/MocA family oxidoreductase [Rhodococcus pseudokoreensis]QSE92074.1 Gfo/Idh/MocA family oxidoreductase [Rhodococcus pseudokoreensis]